MVNPALENDHLANQSKGHSFCKPSVLSLKIPPQTAIFMYYFIKFFAYKYHKLEWDFQLKLFTKYISHCFSFNIFLMAKTIWIPLVLLVCFMLVLHLAQASVPAIFILGDSTADVGTNNFLPGSNARANFPHNGIDFPQSVPTGRFSNGLNNADFLG